MIAKKLVVCITGGPSGGKTTLIDALQKDLGAKIAVAPEAASILYRGGFPRLSSNDSRKHAQRAIYYTQRELEQLISKESPAEIMICDRGSLDSVAYWPGPAEDYLQSVGTNLQHELGRYSWVIHLDTAAHNGFDINNPVRIESHAEALLLNQKILTAWREHPQRIIISHQDDFLIKLTKARKAISLIMGGLSLPEIEAQLKTVSI